jgi:geranylgeranyl pyrophosphate synthase
MALIVAAAEGVGREAGLALAEAAELTHGATLLHDDVIDEADTRRGRPAARRQWSNTLSVLGGDYLLLRSIEVVASLGVPALDAAHRRTIGQLLGAEVAQHRSRRDQDIGTDGYLAVAEGKTAALFAFAAAAPALLAGDHDAAGALERFGIGLGVAFQIADDLRDVLGRDPTKPAALDLQDGVLSLPLRLAAQADADLARDLRAGLGQRLADGEVRALAARVLASPARSGSLALATGHLAASGAALAALRLPAATAPLAGVHAWLAAELRDLEDA